MSPSDLHLLIHFRQRWAKHDPCLLSVFRLRFLSTWQNFSVIQEMPKDTVSNTHPTCLVCLASKKKHQTMLFFTTSIVGNVLIYSSRGGSFWCLPSAWKVTATSSQLSEPPRTGNQRNLVGRPSLGTENRRCSTEKIQKKDHESVIYSSSL